MFGFKATVGAPLGRSLRGQRCRFGTLSGDSEAPTPLSEEFMVCSASSLLLIPKALSLWRSAPGIAGVPSLGLALGRPRSQLVQALSQQSSG